MRDKRLWFAVLILSAPAIIALLVCSRPASARAERGDKDQSDPTYNPYPPGLLPSNLSSETARVLREIDVIENRATARWHALAPPALTGQPPILQDTGTEG